MYACICRSITDKQVTEAVGNGVKCMRDLNTYIGTPTQCGKCCSFVKDLIQKTLSNLESQCCETNCC